MMKKKAVFVTVGTTKFDDLIAAVVRSDVLQLLVERGYTEMTVQYGRGREPEYASPPTCPIRIECFSLKPSIQEHFVHADLVISHAGAGSIFESLDLGKTVIAVVNTSLMHNHQQELADELHLHQYLISCTAPHLSSAIQQLDHFKRIPMPKACPEKLNAAIHELIQKKQLHPNAVTPSPYCAIL
eukprot:ANDGO_08365.mRNA.1 UDP-N-acetylglucosamine transferase subunit alg13